MERKSTPDKHSGYFKLVYQAYQDRDISPAEFSAAIRVLLKARLGYDPSVDHR